MIQFDTKVVKSTLKGLYDNYDIIAHQGGTYSGKTFGIMVALYIYMKNSTESNKIRVIGQTREHLQDGAYDDFINICSLLGGVIRHQEQAKKIWIGNSTIKFLSVDKLGKAKGVKFNITFINEGNYMHYPIARQLMLRTDKTTIIDWNPTGNFWYHDKVHVDPTKNIIYKRTNYKDNPNVKESTIRDIESLKFTDPELYRIYAEGKTGQIKGLIFDKIKYVDEFPKDCKKIAYGLDFGFTNDPTALIKIGELHGELYMQELIYKTGLTNPEIAKEMSLNGVSENDFIYADAAEPKSIAEIKALGFRNIKPAKKGKDSVVHGIQILKQYEKNIVLPSMNLKKEAGLYKWHEDKDGNSMNTPIDNYNHLWDAARYYAIMKLRLKVKTSGIKRRN